MGPHSITEAELESVKKEMQQRKETYKPSRGEPISKDNEIFQKAVEYIATKIFQSSGDEVYIQAKYLGEKIGASSYEVSPVIQTIRNGNVDGLAAERIGSNHRSKRWRIYKDSDGS